MPGRVPAWWWSGLFACLVFCTGCTGIHQEAILMRTCARVAPPAHLHCQWHLHPSLEVRLGEKPGAVMRSVQVDFQDTHVYYGQGDPYATSATCEGRYRDRLTLGQDGVQTLVNFTVTNGVNSIGLADKSIWWDSWIGATYCFNTNRVIFTERGHGDTTIGGTCVGHNGGRTRVACRETTGGVCVVDGWINNVPTPIVLVHGGSTIYFPTSFPEDRRHAKSSHVTIHGSRSHILKRVKDVYRNWVDTHHTMDHPQYPGHVVLGTALATSWGFQVSPSGSTPNADRGDDANVGVYELVLLERMSYAMMGRLSENISGWLVGALTVLLTLWIVDQEHERGRMRSNISSDPHAPYRWISQTIGVFLASATTFVCMDANEVSLYVDALGEWVYRGAVVFVPCMSLAYLWHLWKATLEHRREDRRRALYETVLLTGILVGTIHSRETSAGPVLAFVLGTVLSYFRIKDARPWIVRLYHMRQTVSFRVGAYACMYLWIFPFIVVASMSRFFAIVFGSQFRFLFSATVLAEMTAIVFEQEGGDLLNRPEDKPAQARPPLRAQLQPQQKLPMRGAATAYNPTPVPIRARAEVRYHPRLSTSPQSATGGVPKGSPGRSGLRL